MKKTLYFVLPNLNMGGAERVCVTLMRYINKNKFQVSLIVLDTDNGVLSDELPKDITCIFLNKKSVKGALLPLLRYLRDNPPDILFSSLSHLNLALAMFGFLLPVDTQIIVRESNIVSQNVRLFRFSSIFNIFYKIFYRRLSLLICQTEEMAADLHYNYHVQRQNITIMKNPVDQKKLIEKSKKIDVSRMRKHILVACGRLDYQKGFDILIEAIHLARITDFELLVIGEGELRGKLESQVSDLGLQQQVRFLGFQKNPYPFIKQADLCILSSRFEGMPNVVLESLALGTPVIATPAPGGVTELLKNSKICLLTNDISAQSLASSLKEFLTRKSAKKPEKTLIQPYLAETIIEQFESIIEQNIR